MEKFIPYEKLSPRKKKELNQKRRRTWGTLNPVTRKPNNPKAYKRKSRQNEETFILTGDFFIFPYKKSFPSVV